MSKSFGPQWYVNWEDEKEAKEDSDELRNKVILTLAQYLARPVAMELADRVISLVKTKVLPDS